MKRSHPQSGFTLIELIVAIIVVGVLVAASVIAANIQRQSERAATIVAQMKEIASAAESLRLRAGGDILNDATTQQMAATLQATEGGLVGGFSLAQPRLNPYGNPYLVTTQGTRKAFVETTVPIANANFFGTTSVAAGGNTVLTYVHKYDFSTPNTTRSRFDRRLWYCEDHTAATLPDYCPVTYLAP